MEAQVTPARNDRIRLPSGFTGHHAGRLAPLALDRANHTIDPALLSVSLGGLSPHQVQGAKAAGKTMPALFRAAIRTLTALWRRA